MDKKTQDIADKLLSGDLVPRKTINDLNYSECKYLYDLLVSKNMYFYWEIETERDPRTGGCIPIADGVRAKLGFRTERSE